MGGRETKQESKQAKNNLNKSPWQCPWKPPWRPPKSQAHHCNSLVLIQIIFSFTCNIWGGAMQRGRANNVKLCIPNNITLILTNLSDSRKSWISCGRLSSNCNRRVWMYVSKPSRLFSTYSGCRMPKYFFGGISDWSMPYLLTSWVDAIIKWLILLILQKN